MERYFIEGILALLFAIFAADVHHVILGWKTRRSAPPLERYRQRIDCVDDQLYTLLHKRMLLSTMIGSTKSRKEIENLPRETEILNRLIQKKELAPDFVVGIWHRVFLESKRLQSTVID